MNISYRTNRTRRAAVGLAIAAAALTAPLALTGCVADTPPAESGTDQHSEQPVTIADSWVKATDPHTDTDTNTDASHDGMSHGEMNGAMSGLFGTLTNHTGTDLVITGLASPVAGVVELHEVVDGQMRKIDGDVTIPAGGSLVLAPGANHIMLMELNSELLPGDEVPVVLDLSDGSTFEFTTLVKDTAGANESYEDLEDADHADAEDDSHAGH